MSAFSNEEASPAPTSAFPGRTMLAVLSLFLFVNYLDRYALAILLEPIKEELQLSDTQVGLLTGAAFALLYSTLALPVARIAEHRNRTTVLSAAILIWSVATALCGLAGSFMALFAARMLVGAGESGAVSPAQSMIGDAFSLERRGTALAIFSIGGALGTSLAPMIGGYLEAHFGWRGALLFLGSLGVPVALLLLLVVRDPPRGFADRLVARAPPPPVGLAMRRLFSRPAFALLIPGMVAIGLAEYSFFLWLPSYLSRTFGQPAAAIGTSLTLYQGIPLLIGTLLGGVVGDRLVLRDRRWLAWLPAAACVFAALTIGVIFTSHSLAGALALLVLPSMALGGYLAPCYAMIQALAGPRSRATAVATLTFAVNLLGLGLGPLMIGTLSDLLHSTYGEQSLRYAFLVVPPIYGLAATFLLLASRFILRDMERAARD